MKTIKISLALILAGTTLLTSCNSGSENVVAAEEQHDEHDHDAIQLNNGEKWKVVYVMLGYIRLMEKDINDFRTVEEKDYKVLAEQISVNLNLLTSNCTMTGTAHDELHKWLFPYIDLVDDLENSKSEAEAKEIYVALESSFKTFNTFFN